MIVNVNGFVPLLPSSSLTLLIENDGAGGGGPSSGISSNADNAALLITDVNDMSSLPSAIVTGIDFTSAVFTPASATMSKLLRTCWPSTETLNRRWPAGL